MGRYRHQITPQPAVVVGRREQRYKLDDSLVFPGPNNPKILSVNPPDAEPLFVKRCWDETHPGPPWKSGGPLAITKSSTPTYQVKGQGSWTTKHLGAQTYTTYVGGFTPSSFNLGGDIISVNDCFNAGISGPYSGDWIDAEQFGAEAYHRARPTLERGGLSVFLGELREVPRMLSTTALGFHRLWKDIGGGNGLLMQPKRAADHFLNHQFGWTPFISDLHKFSRVSDESQRMMSDLTEMHGSTIKRRRVVSHTEDRTRIYHGDSPWLREYPELSGMCEVRSNPTRRGTVDVYREVKDHVWFEGSYTMYSQAFDPTKSWHNSNYGHFNRLLALYGARLSPSTVWNLMPWTWAIDYFVNIGDAIEAFDSWAIDGVVSKYAYVMRNRATYRTYENAIYMPNDEVNVSWTQLIESKTRVPQLSPYGFDLSWENLSTRQLSILGALLISRGISL